MGGGWYAKSRKNCACPAADISGYIQASDLLAQNRSVFTVDVGLLLKISDCKRFTTMMVVTMNVMCVFIVVVVVVNELSPASGLAVTPGLVVSVKDITSFIIWVWEANDANFFFHENR